jgi:hypothetical protein
VQRTGPAHAAHDFVQDQQNAVPVADLAHAFEVARRRRSAALRRAADRLGDEGCDGIRSKLADFRVQFVREALAVGGRRFTRMGITVGIGRGDVVGLEQHRRELSTAHGIAADRQHAKRIAMVALAAADEFSPLRLAGFDEILPRHFQAGLHRLRPARNKIDMIELSPRVGFRRVCNEVVGQPLGDIRRKERCVRIGELVELGNDRGIHRRVAMAKARYGGAA